MNERFNRMSRREALVTLGVGAAAALAPLRSQFYRKFFGEEARASADRALFNIVNTSLALERVPAGGKPQIDRIVVKCEAFDRSKVSSELTKLGAKVDTAGGKSVRFRDPIGLGIELAS